MSAPELGECAGFVWDLQRSGLIDRSRLDQVVGDFLAASPGATPDAMAEYLIQSGDLSPFQVETLLAGKGTELVLGEFALIEAIGQGSMGTVYRAVHRNNGHEYALKLLPRRSMWNVRIARRIIRAFEKEHPSVVAFRDVGTAGASHYLAWDMAQGEPLDDRVKRLKRLAPGVAALYALHVAEGLDALNGQGVVHGLIKPSNVLITDQHHALILDFGIGALLSEAKEDSLVDTMSASNTVTTGLDCRSPETILEPTLRTPAGDQYSLGCVLYFCLTGRYPFQDLSPVQKMMAHQTQEPPSVRVAPYVPKALATVVERLMKKTPGERYTGFDEVAEALRPLAVDARMAEQLIKVPAGSPAAVTPAVAAAAPAARPVTRRAVSAPPSPTRPAVPAAPVVPPEPVMEEPYEPEEIPESEAHDRDSDTAEAYIPGETATEAPAMTEEEAQGAEPWIPEEEPAAEYDATPSMMDAMAREDAFQEAIPLPQGGLRSRREHQRRSGGSSLVVRLAALVFGYAIGAGVVGGAIWFLHTQGYLPK
jgi:serine/threonine-protein kinase